MQKQILQSNHLIIPTHKSIKIVHTIASPHCGNGQNQIKFLPQELVFVDACFPNIYMGICS